MLLALAGVVLLLPRVGSARERRASGRVPRLAAAAGRGRRVRLRLPLQLGDTTMGPMVKPFWVDRGLRPEEVALISTTLGVAMSIAGALAGGALSRWHLHRLVDARSCGHVDLGRRRRLDGRRPSAIYAARSSSFGAGPAAAFLSLMNICDKEQAATQFLAVGPLQLERLARRLGVGKGVDCSASPLLPRTFSTWRSRLRAVALDSPWIRERAARNAAATLAGPSRSIRLPALVRETLGDLPSRSRCRRCRRRWAPARRVTASSAADLGVRRRVEPIGIDGNAGGGDRTPRRHRRRYRRAGDRRSSSPDPRDVLASSASSGWAATRAAPRRPQRGSPPACRPAPGPRARCSQYRLCGRDALRPRLVVAAAQDQQLDLLVRPACGRAYRLRTAAWPRRDAPARGQTEVVARLGKRRIELRGTAELRDRLVGAALTEQVDAEVVPRRPCRAAARPHATVALGA